MNAKLKLPPGERDWAVYRRVRVEERTTREVAAEFGISQTRVCQIVEHVGAFVVEAAPEGTEEQRGKRVSAAEQVAAERIDHLYGCAVRSFHASAGEEATVRQVADGPGVPRMVTTVRMSQGNPRYLMLAARLAMLGGKLPVAELPLTATCSEEGIAAEVSENAPPVEEAPSPAKEDCSTKAAEQPVAATTVANEQDAKAASPMDCVQPSVGNASSKHRTTPPVQTRPSLRAGKRAARRSFFAAAG